MTNSVVEIILIGGIVIIPIVGFMIAKYISKRIEARVERELDESKKEFERIINNGGV